jgi:hypothetical protein
MFFSGCFEGQTGTDGNGRSKKLQDERRLQMPFFLAKQQNGLQTIKIYNMKTRFFLGGMILACMISIGIFMQSCSQEDMSELPYLEINPDISKFSESDLNILQMARERMDKHVVLKDGYFQTSLTTGKQINISENLFDIFIASMNQTNAEIYENPILLNPQDMLRPIRLKSGPEIQPGTNGVELRWYGYDAYLNNTTANQFAYYCGQTPYVGSGIALIAGIFGQIEISSVAGMISIYAGMLSNSIDQYNQGNGVIISVYGNIQVLTVIPIYSTGPR